MDTAPAGTPPTPAAQPPRVRRAPDIAVHDHGSIVLLRAASAAGKAWLAWCGSRDGLHPSRPARGSSSPGAFSRSSTRATRAGLVVAAR